MKRQIQLLKMTVAALVLSSVAYAAMNTGVPQTKSTTVTSVPVVVLAATNGVYSTSTVFQNVGTNACSVSSDTNAAAWYYLAAGASLSITDVDLRTWYGKTESASITSTVNAIREFGSN